MPRLGFFMEVVVLIPVFCMNEDSTGLGDLAEQLSL